MIVARISPFSLSRLLIIFVCVLLMISCEDDDKYSIAPDFTTYVDRFVSEANLRGITINTDKLDVHFGDLESDICGQGSPDPPKVRFNKTCWDNLPDVPKEILMFHELGHAILRRQHDQGVLPNGDYKSIMYPDPAVLYNEHTPEKRIYYLDELFNTLNGLPAWTSAKTNEFTVLEDEILDSNDWNFKLTNGANAVGSVVDTAFSSEPYSLALHSNGSATGFSSWSYSWTPNNIAVGSELLLKVKIKADGLTGGGAFFAFRADPKEIEEYPIFFYTIQNSPVKGTTEFGSTEYSIRVNYFPQDVDKLNIYLILDGTSEGTVFFDDIQLLMYQ